MRNVAMGVENGEKVSVGTYMYIYEHSHTKTSHTQSRKGLTEARRLWRLPAARAMHLRSAGVRLEVGWPEKFTGNGRPDGSPHGVTLSDLPASSHRFQRSNQQLHACWW